jgi:hypothetical protein
MLLFSHSGNKKLAIAVFETWPKVLSVLCFINSFSKLMGIFLPVDFGGRDRSIQKVHTTAQTGRNLLTSLTSAALTNACCVCAGSQNGP